MKEQNTPAFIVVSINVQSVKSNDVACMICETSAYIKDNGTNLLFIAKTWICAHGDKAKSVELASSGIDMRSVPRCYCC